MITETILRFGESPGLSRGNGGGGGQMLYQKCPYKIKAEREITTGQ